MQRKIRISLILPVFLICLIILPFVGVSQAYAEGTNNNYKVYSPNENYYVELTSPEKIAANSDNLVILDSNNFFIKGQFIIPYEVTNKVNCLQVSKDIVAYTNDQFKLFLLNKSDPKDDTLNKAFDSLLESLTLPLDSIISSIYLTDKRLYFVVDKDLHSVEYTTTSLSNHKLEKHNDKFRLSSNLYIDTTANSAYCTSTGRELYKIDIATNNVTTLGTYNDNIAFNKDYFVRYNEDNISIFNADGKKTNLDINAQQLGVYKINNLVVNNNELLICDRKNKGIVVFNIDDLLVKQETYPIKNVYGKTGNYPTKFSSPTLIKSIDNKTYVFDSLNKQIKDVTDNENVITYPLVNSEPIIDFAVNNNIIYTVTDTNLYMYDIKSNQLLSSLEKNGIKKIVAYKDTVIVEVDNKLFSLKYEENQITLNELFTLPSDTLDFNLENEGSFIYLYRENNIDKYIITDSVSKIQNINLIEKGIVGPIKDFEIDKNGNIFILYKETNLAYLKNTANGYENAINTVLTNNYYSAKTFADMAISNDKLLLSDPNRNLVYEVTDPNFNNNTIVSEIKKTVVTFDKKPLINPMETKITTNDTIFYKYINNLEVASIIPKDTVIFVFNEPNTKLLNKQLVLYGHELGFVYNKNLNPVLKTPLNYNGKAISEISLFMYPAVTDEANLFAYENKLPIGTKLRVLNSFDSFDNGHLWYEVEYEGNRYFAVQQDIEKDNEIAKTINQMITKSSQIGVSINMYQLADTKSDVVVTVKDGELVDVLDEVGDFYKVKYKDYTGYILKEQLIKDGLTNNQIVAIVVSCVTLVVALVIFITTIVIRKNKKRRI